MGCEDIPGFHQISSGQHDDAAKMEAGLVAKATKVLEEHPQADRMAIQWQSLQKWTWDVLLGLYLYHVDIC